MATMNKHEDKNESLWERWTYQQRLRIAAALDLYIYYLVKNFEARDLFDISVTTDEQQITATMLETVRSQAASASETAGEPIQEPSGHL